MADGATIKFWEDCWVADDSSIKVLINNDSRIPTPSSCALEFVDSNQCWDIRRMMQVISEEIINKIMEIHPPSDTHGPDTPVWCPDQNGKFSIKSAYMCIRSLADKEAMPVWSKIWKCQAFQAGRFLLWRLAHDSLPTRARTARWGNNDPRCVWCKNFRETNTHLFRECFKVARIWRRFINPKDYAFFFNLPLKDWIAWNLGSGKVFCNIPWPTIFTITIYLIWQWRNKSLKEIDFSVPFDPERLILCFAKSHVRAWSVVDPNPNHTVNRCGGLIRDEDGSWIQGFKKRIGIATPLTAELWGIFYGLSLASSIKASRVEIESDSSMIIKHLNNVPCNDLEDNHVMKKIKELISRDWETSFSFIPSKLNRCADYLAKESLSDNWNLDILVSPPSCIGSFIREDASGLIPLSDLGG
ncbi:ribonuclease H [Senna tora]|uniref:Ribonuclease H n=1 Tax=Senna tora TaxID=362788 RepID=A0A834XCX7_9FABA|nr:ribonuclease H [Senna tora]